ncbi:MAG: hypothetical protein AAGL66_09080 [Pseudomonadota bacterium]
MLANTTTLDTERLASASIRQEATYPRFVSFVAVGLGCFDIVRGVVHTVLAGSVAVDVSGIDVSGPSGRDQIVLMTAFGHANFITAAALIQAGLTSRTASLILLSVIPLALLIAGISLNYWGADLQGVGVFPGMNNMRIYVLICTATVATALLLRWRRRPSNRVAETRRGPP